MLLPGYNNGKFFNGLVAVGFELDTRAAGRGRIRVRAGQPQGELRAAVGLEGQRNPGRVARVRPSRRSRRPATRSSSQRPAPTAPCRGEGGGERRTIFYKYCPHAVAWSPCYYNADRYGNLSEGQRGLLMPPSAFGYHEYSRNIWGKLQAEQVELDRLRREQAGPAEE